jgi:hypothetical protein
MSVRAHRSLVADTGGRKSHRCSSVSMRARSSGNHSTSKELSVTFRIYRWNRARYFTGNQWQSIPQYSSSKVRFQFGSREGEQIPAESRTIPLRQLRGIQVRYCVRQARPTHLPHPRNPAGNAPELTEFHCLAGPKPEQHRGYRVRPGHRHARKIPRIARRCHALPETRRTLP